MFHTGHLVPSSRSNRSLILITAVELAVLLAFCLWLIEARWLKLESLDQVDPPMWLFQISRYAQGELPYRDFSWNYPPLTIVVLGEIARRFGATFEVIATCINALSLAIVFASYQVCRLLLPAGTRLAATLAMTGVCATAQTKFNLFSFSTYSPSLHFAALGLLLLWIAGIYVLRNERRGLANGLLIGGCFLVFASKPEAALAALCALAVLAVLDPAPPSWMRRILLFAAATIPAAIVYIWWASLVSPRLLALGVTGYGLASFACPWWPTGLGLFGGLAALSQGVLILATLALLFRRPKPIWLAAIAPALILWSSYLWYLNRSLLANPEAPLRQKLAGVLPSIAWTSPMLLPVMWGGLVYSLYLIWRWWRQGRSLSGVEAVMLFSLTAPIVVSIRGLFGTTLFPITEVSALCYPFFVLLLVILLDHVFTPVALDRPWARFTVTAAWITLYAALRIAVTWSTLFADDRFESLQTEAGRVRMADHGVSARIYRYVLEHTAPGDPVADLPYGGGFNFASRRPGPMFTTQFQQLRTPDDLQILDRERMLMRLPKVIIVESPAPHFNSFYGHRGMMGCPAPRLVWQPDEPSWDPAHVFPVVTMINERYRVDQQIGNHLLLLPIP